MTISGVQIHSFGPMDAARGIPGGELLPDSLRKYVYYEEPGIVLLHGDVREILPRLSNSLDMVVTSPPYDELREYTGYTFNFPLTAIGVVMSLLPGGVLVWNVGDMVKNGSETGTAMKQSLYFKDRGLNLHDTMIYEKHGVGLPDPTRYFQTFEYMYVFSKGTPKTINLIKDHENKGWDKNFGSNTVREVNGETTKRKQYKLTERFSVRRNIWKIKEMFGFAHENNIAHKHPATFPLALPRDHIRTWTNEGDIVLDPFLGSGTTAVACKQLGRKCIGIELESKYLDIAIERLRQEVLF